MSKLNNNNYYIIFNDNNMYSQYQNRHFIKKHDSSNIKIEQNTFSLVKEIANKKADIKNKTVYFLNGIEIKQEVFKQKFSIQTTKDPNKADYIIYGKNHIDNIWWYTLPQIRKDIYDILHTYHSKMIHHSNILTTTGLNSRILSEEDALKLFRMSCSDEQTNQKLLKTLVIDIDYKLYPLLIGILLRRLKPKAGDNIYKNYYREYYSFDGCIRVGNIYTNSIDFSWILKNTEAKDIDLIVSIFNNEIPHFELKRKNENKQMVSKNEWNL